MSEFKEIHDYAWNNPVLTRKEVHDLIEEKVKDHPQTVLLTKKLNEAVRALAFSKAAEQMNAKTVSEKAASASPGKWEPVRTPTREEETQLLDLRVWLFRHFMETGKYPTPRHCMEQAWKFSQEIFDYGISTTPLR